MKGIYTLNFHRFEIVPPFGMAAIFQQHSLIHRNKVGQASLWKQDLIVIEGLRLGKHWDSLSADELQYQWLFEAPKARPGVLGKVATIFLQTSYNFKIDMLSKSGEVGSLDSGRVVIGLNAFQDQRKFKGIFG